MIAVVIVIAGIRALLLLLIFVTVTLAVIVILNKFHLRSQLGLYNNPVSQCLVLACPCLAVQSFAVRQDDKKTRQRHIYGKM